MTDNEIIKALECCFIHCNCADCPLNSPQTEWCVKVTCEQALCLINRQKAEIERITLEYAGFQAGVKHFADIGKTIRAEAIKEFAERLCEGRVSNDPVVIAAKCLLKEMTEDNHDHT